MFSWTEWQRSGRGSQAKNTETREKKVNDWKDIFW